MNAIGIALVWCVVQITLLGLLVGGLYLVVRWWRPAAAAPILLTGLAMVVVLSLLAVSPWPQWRILSVSPSAAEPAIEALPEAEDVAPGPSDEPFYSWEEDSLAAASGRENPPIQDRPSAAARLWQAILNELALSQAASRDAWHWPATVAVLLLVAMLCGLAWFVLGLLAMRAERLRSRTVDDRDLLELVDVLRAELGCCRPIEVRQSDGLITAATIGWLRPLLLLPADWSTWTADQRRAVLAHEIAHVRSQDFLALLFGQLGLVLHFYHPLLHWLSSRLRLEQELAADAAAANVLGGQREYLMTIAELALRQHDRTLAWPARSFLPTQTTFLRRIAVLRDSKRRFDRLSPAARVVVVGVLLFGGLMIAGLRGPAGQEALADDAEKRQASQPLGNPPPRIPAGYSPGGTQTDTVLARPGSEAVLKQIESLARTAAAGQNARSVHIAARMRTLPGDNFSFLDAKREFVSIEIWKEFGNKPKWRVEKPLRVVVMDGNSTVMLIAQQTVVKVPQATPSAFDTYWLVGLCDSKELIDRELRGAVSKGWDVKVAEETSGGEKNVVVTVESKSGLSDSDHMKNKFYMTSDLRLVYRFDAKTARLQGFEAYLHQAGGDTKVFATERIEYDQPMDPKVFTLEIPKTAHEYKEPQRLPDNEKYEKMTPLEAARTFFEACHKDDWKEAEKFEQPLTEDMKQYLGGLEVVHLGEPFQPKLYPGWMIPYEIKFKNGATKKWNLAMRKDNPAKRYVVDGGL